MGRFGYGDRIRLPRRRIMLFRRRSERNRWTYVAASNFEVFALRSDGTLWIGGENAKFTAPAYVPGRARGCFGRLKDTDWKEFAGQWLLLRSERGRQLVDRGETPGDNSASEAQRELLNGRSWTSRKLPFEMEPWALALAPDYSEHHVLTKEACSGLGTRLGIPTPDAESTGQ